MSPTPALLLTLCWTAPEPPDAPIGEPAGTKAAEPGATGPNDPPRGRFVTPIGGTPWEDWTIVSYVDVDGAYRSAKDARGGDYVRDFHEGIDFSLANFAAMDSGVKVLAAADGVVFETADGQPDRYSGDIDDPKSRPKTRPNLVRIDHGDGVRTSYLHLKKGSVLVKPGERVTAGQALGEVGSSGMSSGPHLHFEVRSRDDKGYSVNRARGGAIIATLEDPAKWWRDPLPYAGEVAGVLDHGAAETEPTEREMIDRPADAGPFVPRQGKGTVYIWARLFGFGKHDRLEYQFKDPRGRVRNELTFRTPEIRYGWWTARVDLPRDAYLGEWTVVATRNRKPLFTQTFKVAARVR